MGAGGEELGWGDFFVRKMGQKDRGAWGRMIKENATGASRPQHDHAKISAPQGGG